MFAEVGRFSSAVLVDVHGILCAVLTPVPVVILASPNILHHFYPSYFKLLLGSRPRWTGMPSCKQEIVFVIVNLYLQYCVLINCFVCRFNTNTRDFTNIEHYRTKPEREGIVRTQGFVIYVADTNPGDRVKIETTRITEITANGQISNRHAAELREERQIMLSFCFR